jgi:protein disulfide-isomerase A1
LSFTLLVLLFTLIVLGCGHCKALAPEYEKAATALKSEKIPIAKVDCTVETDVCQQNGVQGYPTLKIFRDSKATDYQGPRTADGIVSIMKRQNLPAVSILNEDQVSTFAQSDRVVIIGLFDDVKSSEYKAFAATADELRDKYNFGYTKAASALADHKVTAPAIVLFKKFDEGSNVFEGKFSVDTISEFVTKNSVALMDDIGPDNYELYMKRNLPILYLFVSNNDQRQDVGPEVEPLAKKYAGQISFVYIDAGKFFFLNYLS